MGDGGFGAIGSALPNDVDEHGTATCKPPITLIHLPKFFYPYAGAYHIISLIYTLLHNCTSALRLQLCPNSPTTASRLHRLLVHLSFQTSSPISLLALSL